MDSSNDGVMLYGAPYSVYVRIARLALEEKGVAYGLRQIDIFAEGGLPADYLARQPFGRIPALEHGEFQLYETAAITRYVDEAFPGPALQPAEPRARARVAQVIGILDSYAYRTFVWDIYVARRESGRDPDPKVLTRAETCLSALRDLKGAAPWLAGPELSLADLHAAPMICYLRMTREGQALLRAHPGLSDWWRAMAERPSMATTRFPSEEKA